MVSHNKWIASIDFAVHINSDIKLNILSDKYLENSGVEVPQTELGQMLSQSK